MNQQEPRLGWGDATRSCMCNLVKTLHGLLIWRLTLTTTLRIPLKQIPQVPGNLLDIKKRPSAGVQYLHDA